MKKFGRLLFIAVLFITELAPCAVAQEILSIKIAEPTAKISANSFALSQIAEISGPKTAARTAGFIRFSTAGTLTREEVVDAIQRSGITGVKIELRMPQSVSIQSSVPQNGELVKKGKTVTIFTNLNGIFVEAQGEAQQSGSLGDVIRVRNLASKKLVSGVVVAPNRVEVRK